jgi:hypothetical protein
MQAWGGKLSHFLTQTEQPLRVMFLPGADRFQVSLRYYRRCFSAGDIDEILADYFRMLVTLLEAEDARVSQVLARADVRALSRLSSTPG